MRRKGFTLIELLVVVAIIVILAGILYPVFASTRRAAYSAACISNLKQIGLAVNMYTQDYDETFPVACCQFDREPTIRKAQPADYPNTKTPFLWEVLKPYVKNPGLWRCPADNGFGISALGISFVPSGYAATGSSYNYNTDLAWLHTGPDSDQFERIGQWAPMSMGNIQKPHETFISAEPAGTWHNSIKGSSWAEKETYRYNHVFVDGHARGMTQSQVNDIWSRDRDKF